MFKKYGGGRSPDNLCGALYTALFLLEDDIQAQEGLKKEFEKKVGYICCRDIRKEGRVTCKDCVGIAAGLLDDLI